MRIIGGDLRSRQINFPDAEGLRPTPDRVRETLFNWLGQTLYGRSCLDLFAGSGALGLEAASRGAEHVTMVERNPQVCRVLQQNVRSLGCTQVQVRQHDGLLFLQQDSALYDVIFVDPPYQSDYLSKLWPLLESRLNSDGVVYLESGAPIEVPETWQVLKQGKAGQVYYQLLSLA